MAQKVVMILFYFVCYNTLLQLGSPLLYLQRISPQVLPCFTVQGVWLRVESLILHFLVRGQALGCTPSVQRPGLRV